MLAGERFTHDVEMTVSMDLYLTEDFKLDMDTEN